MKLEEIPIPDASKGEIWEVMGEATIPNDSRRFILGRLSKPHDYESVQLILVEAYADEDVPWTFYKVER